MSDDSSEGLLSLRVINDPDQLREAIAAGADVNARARDGTRPLHWCNNQGSLPLLIAAGADVDARDELGRTALYQTSNPLVASALLEAGADWTIEDDFGDTAADFHRHVAHPDIVDVIERWTATELARGRAGAMNEQLKASETVEGPGL